MSELRSIPLGLLEPSPFEPREKIEPLESAAEVGVIAPLIVRPKGTRFEVLAGHRRLETLKQQGVADAVCRVFDMDDEKAALVLFLENQDRADLTDYERGVFFQKFMAKFQFSEREAAQKLGTSHTTISLCLGVVQARERMVLPRTTETIGLYERTMTRNKFSEVNRLSEEHKNPALQAVVENRLSTEETKTLTAKIEQGSTVERATNAILLRREMAKPERYAERKRRETCPTCRGRGWILRSETN